jgi:YHS domain-containing protein
MKRIKTIAVLMLAATFLAGPLTLFAADGGKPKAKPYPLKTCVVSGEKLGGMGDPYVFVHEGQEIKLCCKGCLKDFKKEPAKYLKKIEEAEKNKK